MHWADYFFKLCGVVAEKSKDKRTKVGAIIVGPGHEILSTGYNGFCRGIDETSCLERFDPPDKYDWTEHAERNAIYNAARKILNGTTIYLEYGPCPCINCTRAIIQCGIKEIVMPKDKSFPGQGDQWKREFTVALSMLTEAGVKITYHETNPQHPV